MKTLLVDTTATNQRYKFSAFNLGAAITADYLKADLCCWRDKIENISQYDLIGFSTLWPPYILNISPFLKKHSIKPLKEARHQSPLIIVGGQGGTNISGALDNIADYTFKGEIENNYTDHKGYHRATNVLTNPYIYDNNRHAALEVSRGCEYKCAFCEYSHVLGGPYREKPFDLLKNQIRFLQNKGIKQIQFRSANIAGISYLDDLVPLIQQASIYTRTGDITLKDAHRIIPHIKALKITYAKIGVESFDEQTRKSVNKTFSDEQLYETVYNLALVCPNIYFFLIFGLPGDNYSNWLSWLEKLAKLRESIRATHKVRYCFSICNFRPTPGTPMQNSPPINFIEKYKFIQEFTNKAKSLGFYRTDWDVSPGHDQGRFGRTESSHLAIEALVNSGTKITNTIINSRGTGRYISKPMAKKLIAP
jgi:hypothetical protein